MTPIAQIDFAVVWLFQEEFWCHVFRSPEDERELLPFIDCLCKAKVSNLADHCRVHVVQSFELYHDVAQIEVSMHHILPV